MPYIKMGDAAHILGITISAARGMVNDGRLKSVHQAQKRAHMYVLLSEVQALAAARQEVSAARLRKQAEAAKRREAAFLDIREVPGPKSAQPKAAPPPAMIDLGEPSTVQNHILKSLENIEVTLAKLLAMWEGK
jgi:hypothetical protein